jgi:hypothetical protein
VYNAKGQVIKYMGINRPYTLNMSYDNEDRLTAAESYQKTDGAWLLSEKFRIVSDTEGMKIYTTRYDVSKGTSGTALDTLLFTIDQEQRFTDLAYSYHTPYESNDAFFYTTRRNYMNHQLANCVVKIFVYPNKHGFPNGAATRLTLDYTVNYEYSDIPNKLYAMGKDNPFLIYIIGEDNVLLAGHTQVKKTTTLGSTFLLDGTAKRTSVFTYTYYPNTAYIRTRKTTTEAVGNGVPLSTSTYTTQYYYIPAP